MWYFVLTFCIVYLIWLLFVIYDDIIRPVLKFKKFYLSLGYSVYGSEPFYIPAKFFEWIKLHKAFVLWRYQDDVYGFVLFEGNPRILYRPENQHSSE